MEIKVSELTIDKVLADLERTDIDPQDQDSQKVLNMFRQMKKIFGGDMRIEISLGTDGDDGDDHD